MTAAPEDVKPEPSGAQRLDKWLWFARLVKSRTLASSLIEDGKIRVNRVRIAKSSHLVRAGDVITSTVRKEVRVFRVLAPGLRRGPAAEARQLYEDLTAANAPRAEGGPNAATDLRQGERSAGSGRPTKLERRQTERLRGRA